MPDDNPADSATIKNAEEHWLIFSKDKKTLLKCTNKDITEAVIPEGIKQIKPWTFAGCTNLTGAIIPLSVTEIREHAFHACTSLTDLVISDSVTSIGTAAFSQCSSLISVILPDSIKNKFYRLFIIFSSDISKAG